MCSPVNVLTGGVTGGSASVAAFSHDDTVIDGVS